MSSDDTRAQSGKPRIVIGLDDFDDPDPGPAAPQAQAPALRRASPPAVAPAPPAGPAPAIPVGPPVKGMAPGGAPPRALEACDMICGVREVIDSPFDPEDSFILPVPALQPDCVLLEPRDGADVRSAHANEVAVRAGERDKHLIRASDIRALVQITDARLTLGCSKYDKGGGWVGGPFTMIALNAGSKLLAARRRRGRMLVGQVRYPWIHAVYAQNKGGWAGVEQLRVIVECADQLVRLELTFPKDVNATAVATELIHRAARFRLACEPELDAHERSELARLAEIPPLVWRKGSKEMAGHEFPSHWPVGNRSAGFGLPGAS